jgi:hypothetical protein
MLRRFRVGRVVATIGVGSFIGLGFYAERHFFSVDMLCVFIIVEW